MWAIVILNLITSVVCIAFHHIISHQTKSTKILNNPHSKSFHNIDEDDYAVNKNVIDKSPADTQTETDYCAEPPCITEEGDIKSSEITEISSTESASPPNNEQTYFRYNYDIQPISTISPLHSDNCVELIYGIEFETNAYELYKRLSGIYKWDISKKYLFYDTSKLYAQRATPEGFGVYFIKRSASKDFSSEDTELIVEICNCDSVPDCRDTCPMIIFTESPTGGYTFCGIYQLIQAKHTSLFYTKAYQRISKTYPIVKIDRASRGKDTSKEIEARQPQDKNMEKNTKKNMEENIKNVMKVNECIYARTHADFLNKLLDRNYKGFQQSGVKLKDGKWLWMIRLGYFTAPSGFKNYLETPERIIEECSDTKDLVFKNQGTYLDVVLNNKPLYPTERVVFDIVETSSSRKYVFRGVFRLNKHECTLERNVWDLISDEYQF